VTEGGVSPLLRMNWRSGHGNLRGCRVAKATAALSAAVRQSTATTPGKLPVQSRNTGHSGPQA